MRLIERAWYQNHPIKWLLLLLTPIFWALSALRRMAYRCHLLKQPKLPVPVVIVGNIGVGGNGKTPVVVYLVEQLKAKGFKVGVISRGYGGSVTDTPFVVSANVSAKEAGDEPVLIYQRTEVPVVIGSDRVKSVEQLISLGCNVVISDDGLQHYRLKRDVELVIIDGKRRYGNGWLLPAGPLREGIWRLNTVDRVIVNGGLADVDELAMSLSANKVININSGQQLSLEQFNALIKPIGKVNAIAGIGNPQRFFNTLLRLKLPLAQSLGFVDHHQFQSSDFDQLDANIPLLMTEKDAVKCQGLVSDNAWYLPVDARFDQKQGEQLIELIITRCNNYGL
ncbi:tetraacyldisaccharide 4'-kinase [Thalassotalea aquiviva]|uniref:tetraacyldisaccharide 4'-kinase n=1 Tax=Thalassotalea aquiviva TaxID=3242415 RepID=UPI00352A5B30